MRLFILLFIFSFSYALQAQPKDLSGYNNNQIAQYYINFLKNGALFVRLQTKSRKIAILKRAGDIAAAEKVSKNQEKINLSIIKAFKEVFTFCPTYFFYNNDSKYVMRHELDKVKFLDENLRHNAAIKPPKNFLTIEIAVIKEDTVQNKGGTRFQAGSYYKKDSVGGLTEIPYYSGGSNMSFGALIIKSDQFIQLPKPFPYYVRNLATLPMLRRSHSKVVGIMNKNLEEFYALAGG